MNIWRIAWRNVLRNRRRSIVTIAAMTLALLVLVLYSGLVEGYLRGMERNIVDLELGDVQVHAEGYLERPSKFTRIEDPAAVLARLDEAGYPASARLLTGGLGAAGDASAGIALRGLNVEREARVSRLHRSVARGSWLDPDDPLGVVVGHRLARTLAVSPGDEIYLMTQAMDGGMTDGLYEVRGVLQMVADGTDRSAVFMTEGAFRELLFFPEGAHQIVIRRPDDITLAEAGAVVREAAGADLDVHTWADLLPVISQMLESTRGLLIFLFGIFYVAVGILILNGMLTAVFERIREFGMFKAIGTSPFQVLSLIVLEGLYMMGLATVIGLTLAVPCMWYLGEYGIDIGSLGGLSIQGVAMEPVWRGVYSLQTLIVPVVMLYVIGLLALLYPALKAAWIKPVRAMQHQ